MTALTFAQEEIVNPGAVGQNMWLVPLLPFLAFFVILFFGRRLRDRGHSIGIAAVGIGFLLSIAGFVELMAGKAAVEKSWVWFRLGETFELELGMNYDFLCGIMFIVVTT